MLQESVGEVKQGNACFLSHQSNGYATDDTEPKPVLFATYGMHLGVR